MNIETKLLEDFLSLAHTRSFSRSAELRYVTQPAFSRRIKQLEQMLGFPLINREVTPIELTKAGKQFIPCARNSLEQLKEGIQYIRTLQNEQVLTANFASTHVLTLSYFPLIANFLEDKIRKFSSKLTVLDAYDSQKLLCNGMCDFLLGFADYSVDLNNFDILKLGKIKLLPVCKPAADGSPLFSLNKPSIDVPILDYRKNIYFGKKVREIKNRRFASSHEKITLRPLVESTMADTLKALAISGLGVTWIPHCNIMLELEQSQLVVCGNEDWQSELDVVIYRDNKPKNDYLKKIWKHLQNLHSTETEKSFWKDNESASISQKKSA